VLRTGFERGDGAAGAKRSNLKTDQVGQRHSEPFSRRSGWNGRLRGFQMRRMAHDDLRRCTVAF
jgi:hypothetical protein